MTKTDIDKLMELKQLYEQGILSKEEMEAEKKKILGIAAPKTESPNSDCNVEPGKFSSSDDRYYCFEHLWKAFNRLYVFYGKD